MYSQIIVFLVIGITLYLFIDGRLRYDFVALLALITLTLTGVITAKTAFLGFSHPAIITVAAVLVISCGLTKTGVIDSLSVVINSGTDNISIKVMSLMGITVLLSAFMNNAGALALVMPIAITVSKDNNILSATLLMPIAFSSLLGGMITGIGTPPNMIVSNYRIEAGYEAFSLFSFAPVGIILSLLGIIFTTLIGWRLIPKRHSKSTEKLFNIEDYLFELIVREDCDLEGCTLKDFYKEYKIYMNVLSVIRDGNQIIVPRANEQLLEGDIIIIKALPSDISNIVSKTGLSLKSANSKDLTLDKDELIEVVLMEDSILVGKTALETRLRNRYNINLVAVSRKGTSNIDRLKSFRFKTGDVLMIQVPENILQDTLSKLRLLPLAQRDVDINIEKPRKDKIVASGVFLLSILIITLGFAPVEIVFTLAAVSLVVLKIITPEEFYEAIEWPTIIMLGALFSLGNALESSGASHNIAGLLMKMSSILNPTLMVGFLMLISMSLTNIIGSSVTAVIMGPIALSLSGSMGVSPDPFLMGVSVAASAAFLTPIGHQSNTLVMEPGGYKFRDYWHLGLPLCIIVLIVGAPLILYLWPL